MSDEEWKAEIVAKARTALSKEAPVGNLADSGVQVVVTRSKGRAEKAEQQLV